MLKIRIVWNNEENKGFVWAANGKVASGCETIAGQTAIVGFENVNIEIGPNATLVHVDAGEKPFSFFLRDVRKENPIYIPSCDVVVTTEDDTRCYEQLVTDIVQKDRKSVKEQVEAQEEYSYEKAADNTKKLDCPAWLGVSKDMRIFQVDMRGRPFVDRIHTLDEIRPLFFHLPHSREQLPEFEGNPYVLYMLTGRGVNCRSQITKRLEDGCLPILHITDVDDGVEYHTTHFVTMEKSPLTKDCLRGTDMYVADSYGMGYMHTPEQKAHTDSLLKTELDWEEETVLYYRVVVENKKAVPTYGFLRMPDPLPKWSDLAAPTVEEKTILEPDTGYLRFSNSGRICVIGKVDGKPIRSQEIAVLAQPNEKITFDFVIPHTPVSRERADQLQKQAFDERLSEAKTFWENELVGIATIQLPEKRIEEMIKAGVLHMDIGYFGKNPKDPVVPIVGRYTAIGSESSPCIQMLDSLGMHELSTRAIAYFVEKQHEDGFMQNFGGYMLETGSTLWTMGEHWRLTRDIEWAKSVKNCIKKAADYLVHWREENMTENLEKGHGYGMISGKIADPEDYFHSFMLNAGAYAGLRSAGELLQVCGDESAQIYSKTADQMRQDIRASFFRNMELAPVAPASDGTWYRTHSPNTEGRGLACLYANEGMVYTHGTFMLRDTLSAVYLILQGVIDADEPVAEEILKAYEEILSIDNVAFSQPYYSQHPYVQLMRGDVKQFLKAFYNEFAGLADRGSYSFWEHHFLASPHKLHEEGWFLMRCRWMLALEEEKTKKLRLLAGAPRKWLDDGNTITIEHLKTYYGDVSLTVNSQVNTGVIHVQLNLEGFEYARPDMVTIRIPHPEGKKAKHVSKGVYCTENETIILTEFDETVQIDVLY